MLQRVTDEFDARSVPAGLLRAHRIAPGTWGVVRVRAGAVTFVWEGRAADPVVLQSGDSLVVVPDEPHHIEPTEQARFVIEFHR